MAIDSQNESRSKSLSPMFSGIIGQYDLINHVFTWGMDKRWRDELATECLKTNPEKVLEIGCGTGDLAINIASRSLGNVPVTGYDFSRPMLEIAAKKAQALTPNMKISFIYGEVAQMPFPSESFDCIGISFAFRNLIYNNQLADRHLAEILRVLKPGGSCFNAESRVVDHLLFSVRDPSRQIPWIIRSMNDLIAFFASGRIDVNSIDA